MFSRYYIHPVHLSTPQRVTLMSTVDSLIDIQCPILGMIPKQISANRDDVHIGSTETAFSGDVFSDCLSALRRNASLEWDLSDQIQSPEPHTTRCFFKVFLLATGDICLLYAAQFNDVTSATDLSQADYFQNVLPHAEPLISALVTRIALSAKIEIGHDLETPIHRVFGGPDTAEFRSRLDELFIAEGLELADCAVSQHDGPSEKWAIFGGWSYSAILRQDHAEEFYFTSLMIRLQINWLKARRIRSSVLESAVTRTSDLKGQRLKTLNTAMNELTFYLQISRQQRADYRANLKPWLANCYDATDDRWQVEEDYESLHNAVCDFRDFVKYVSDEKSKLQLEIQSKLLYFIAGLDTLAISSFALSLLSFRRAEASEFPSWIQSTASSALTGLVVINVVLLLAIFILGFVRRD